MYLMFQLRRLDVWPVDDLGIRPGYGLIWGIKPPPAPKRFQPLGDRFRPYRSIVARYCWEAVWMFRNGTERERKALFQLSASRQSKRAPAKI